MMRNSVIELGIFFNKLMALGFDGVDFVYVGLAFIC